MAVRCRRTSLRRSHGLPRCRHSKPEEAREKREVERGGGYRGREGGEVSRVKRLEAGYIARESGGIKSHKGRGAPCYKSRFWEFDRGRAWVVEKPYNVAFEDVGWFLDFTKSPGTINAVIPNGSLQ